ncbi:carboxypeptidase-like regulatory domain-containing protein [Croceiramulus getboli]|nr:carboxypeptidase-like regulatory domain-containing protein [Flavobacteriaceae bacterium YJPT1-3]
MKKILIGSLSLLLGIATYGQNEIALNEGEAPAYSRTSTPTDESTFDFESQDQVHIYWDNSKSMESRDQALELEFLKQYFQELPRVQVKLTTFDIEEKESTFLIENGDITALAQKLADLRPDGATDFSQVRPTSDTDAVLLFTDGNASFGSFRVSAKKPMFLVSSVKQDNAALLAQLAAITKGRYVNLKANGVQESYRAIRFRESLKRNNDDDGLMLISGKIKNASEVIQGVEVGLKNSLRTVETDADGNFEIMARKGDILTFDFFGTYPKEVKITGNEPIELELASKNEMLEAVVVNGVVQDQEEELRNEIRTVLGKVDKRILGYRAYTITGDELNPAAIDLMTAVSGKFPGLGFGVGSYSGSISLPAGLLVVIDGVAFGGDFSEQQIPYVDINNIQTVTFTRSIQAGMSLFGTQSRNGVLIVTTKTGPYSLSRMEQEAFNTALIRGNDYQESPLFYTQVDETPDFLKPLQATTSYNEALVVYQDSRKENALNIPYYLEVADFFKKYDPKKSEIIRSNIGEIGSENVKALKTLAYELEAEGEIDRATKVYERILELEPYAAQSYRDLALLYVEQGAYQKAFDFYLAMINNSVPQVDFSGLQSEIDNELRHLIANHKEKVDFSQLDNDYLKVGYKQDVRVVIDYNNPNDDFEIQFVSPDKKYFTWKHTAADNLQRLLDENRLGFSTEEFILDDAGRGEWIVNLRYLGENQNQVPTYLKYTVYKNYGTAQETKEVRVLPLYRYEDKVTIDRIQI